MFQEGWQNDTNLKNLLFDQQYPTQNTSNKRQVMSQAAMSQGTTEHKNMQNCWRSWQDPRRAALCTWAFSQGFLLISFIPCHVNRDLHNSSPITQIVLYPVPTFSLGNTLPHLNSPSPPHGSRSYLVPHAGSLPKYQTLLEPSNMTQL